MLIKMIKCEVNEDSKEIFHAAQTKWKELELAGGFAAQWGGWNLLNKEEAVIIALWESREAYTLFMTEHHDKIMDTNEQVKTYRKIEVSLWSTDESMDRAAIKDAAFTTIIDAGDYNMNGNEKGKAVLMTQLDHRKSSEVIIFKSELEGEIEDVETAVKLEKEWTVSAAH